MARFNQTEGCQTAEVKARICRAARKFGIDSAFEEGGFCKGGKKMSKEKEAEGTDEEEERRRREEEEKAKDKPLEGKTTDELLKMIREQESKKLRSELAKKYKETEEEIKKSLEEDRFTNMNKEIGIIKASIDELRQAIEKISTLETRVVKMEELPEFKGHGLEKGTKAVSVTELAMGADTLSNPLALRKLVEEPEDIKEGEEE